MFFWPPDAVPCRQRGCDVPYTMSSSSSNQTPPRHHRMLIAHMNPDSVQYTLVSLIGCRVGLRHVFD